MSARWRRYLRLGGDVRAEVDDEIAYHLQMKAEALEQSGLSAEAALQEAQRQFGDREQVRTEVSTILTARRRDVRRANLIDEARQDIRYAVRQLRTSPLFTTVAVVTLALGIGATTAIFSVVRAALLRPLPYEGGDQIVVVGETSAQEKPDPNTTTSYANYEDWRTRTQSYEGMAVFDGWSPTLTGAGEAERLAGSIVTSDIFTIFRLRPELGRVMQPSDNTPGAPRLAWISWHLWQTHLAGARDVIGRTLTLNGVAHEIAGVLPKSFVAPSPGMATDVWSNNYMDERDTRSSRYLNVVARLKGGVTLERARAEMTVISAQLASEYPATNREIAGQIFPLRELVIGGNTRRPILILMLSAALLLLIACANISNLLVARASYRVREFAIRAALGTTRGRIFRQVLTESVVLAVLGTGAGVLLAVIALRGLIGLAPEGIRSQSVGIDPMVLWFSVLCAAGAAVLFGVIPARRASRTDVEQTLREQGGGVTSARSRRVRSVLAVVQLSLALALLLSAGLMIKSFANMMRVDPGIRPDHLLTASMSLPSASYMDAAIPRFYDALTDRLRGLPGVIDATVTSTVPFSGEWDRVAVDTGVTRNVPIDLPEGDRYIVDPSYFATMGIPLRSGRLLERTDSYENAPVVVVDEVFARKLVPSGDAIGFRMRMPGRDSMATVVGIVGHVKHYGLDAESGGQLYVSHVQYPWRWMSIVMRVEGEPYAYTARLRDAVRSLDTQRPIYDVATMDSLMAQRSAVRRFVIALLGVFAGIALILASIGLYGVVAYTVSQRHREFGIRIALGSTPHALVQLVLREGVVLVVGGVLAGIALAAAGARLLRGFLFQVDAADPRVALVAIGSLALTAALASWIPARRAARLDPVSSIRAD